MKSASPESQHTGVPKAVGESPRILIFSEVFAPSLGGVQMVTRLLAEALHEIGCQVTVLTNEPGVPDLVPGVRVVRRPGLLAALRAARAAHGVICQGLAFKWATPALACRGPRLLVRHIEQSHTGALRPRLARAIETRFQIAAVSRFMASLEQSPAMVLPNPYDDKTFYTNDAAPRAPGVIWVGRMIPEKGVATMAAAWECLPAELKRCPMTFIGDGPERQIVEDLVRQHQQAYPIRYLGPLSGIGLADELRKHTVLVVSSICNESFGIVAIEAIASGCVVVGSNAGGLREAIGPCGVTFPHGDEQALASTLADVLPDGDQTALLRRHADEHLSNHKPRAVALKYLEAMGFLNACLDDQPPHVAENVLAVPR